MKSKKNTKKYPHKHVDPNKVVRLVIGNMYRVSLGFCLYDVPTQKSRQKYVGAVEAGQLCQLVEMSRTKTKSGPKLNLRFLAGLQIGWLSVYDCWNKGNFDDDVKLFLSEVVVPATATPETP